jgi:hypothetical protein
MGATRRTSNSTHLCYSRICEVLWTSRREADLSPDLSDSGNVTVFLALNRCPSSTNILQRSMSW